MKGKVLDYTIQTNEGVISGEDGKRYQFLGSEWKSSQSPRQGMAVDFEADGEQAKSVYADVSSSGMSEMSSKRMTAALLAFFLGAFGAHKFYLGIKQPAIIMLVVSIAGILTSCFLFGLPTLAMSVIAIIEFVMYLTKSDEEFEQVYVIGKKPWF